MAANFEDLKKVIKKIAFRRKQKIPSGNVIAWCVDLNEKIKKFVMGTSNIKKKSKRNNFAGGLGSENFICFQLAGFRQLSLAPYLEMTSLGM